MTSVESLKEALRGLVAERQALGERHADRNELESNRLELVERQQQFSRALIDRCLTGMGGQPC
jgi:transcriptional regulatory protein LevR